MLLASDRKDTKVWKMMDGNEELEETNNITHILYNV